MGYLFSALINLLLDLLTTFLDTVGTAVVSMLCLDIGTGKSFFELTFPVAPQFLTVFLWLAFTILFLNYGWQLFKIMATADSGAESPLALTGRTIMAGIFMGAAPKLILIAENAFSKFYSFLLGIDTDIWAAEGVFKSVASGFVGAITGAVEVAAGAAAAATGGAAAIAGAAATLGTEAILDAAGSGEYVVHSSITGTVIVLIMMFVLGYQFMQYLIEVVERYVLLAILYYTSPMAFSMAGSKSTSNIFASWVRMVFSQLFLMICNVFFMRLFIEGMSRYIESASDIQNELGHGATSTAVAILWCLVNYGILYVGTRIDSYLNTIGLSAAQTGRGMAMSVALGARSVRAGLMGAYSLGKTGVNFGKNVHSNYKERNQSATMTSSGILDEKSMKAQANGNIDQKELHKFRGSAFKNALQRDLDGLSPDVMKQIVQADGSYANGGFRATLMNEKTGKTTDIFGVPAKQLTTEQMQKTGGIMCTRNGEAYFVTAKGSGAVDFYTSNEDNKKLHDLGFKPIVDANGEAVSGKWWRTIGGKDGTPERTEVLENSSVWQQPSSVVSTLTKEGEYGSAQFWRHEDAQPAIWRDTLSGEYYVGDKAAVEQKLSMLSTTYPASANGDTEGWVPPEYNLERVDPATLTGEDMNRFAAFDDLTLSQMNPSLVPSAADRSANFERLMPELSNVQDAAALPAQGNYENGFDGNFRFTGQDGNNFVAFNTLSHQANLQNVNDADINFTRSSSGVMYGVIELQKGQRVGDVIQARADANERPDGYQERRGTQFPEMSQMKEMEPIRPVDVTSEQSNGILAAAWSTILNRNNNNGPKQGKRR